MATHSIILLKRILWTEEPGGLPSMRSHRARHDWSNLAAAAAAASPALQVDSLPTELSGKPIFFMIISTFFLCWYFGYKPSLYLLNTIIFLFALDFFCFCIYFLCVLVTPLCPILRNPMDWEAHQAPLSMVFCGQEYWSGLPFPSPGDLFLRSSVFLFIQLLFVIYMVLCFYQFHIFIIFFLNTKPF